MLDRLHRKFVAAIMVVSTLLLCILLFVIFHLTAIHLRTENIRMMQTVGNDVTSRDFSPAPQRPDERLHYFVLARTPENELIVTGNTGFELEDRQLMSKLYESACESNRDTGVLKAYALRFYKLDSTTNESYMFSDISDELATLHSLRQGGIAIALISLLVLFAISNLMAKWMIRPVAITWALQKEFVANASHELKTPLTVIMTNADLLTSPDYAPEEKAKLVEGIAAMSLRMRQLVDGMLDLAQVDSGVKKSAFTLLNYSELVEQSLLPFEPAFFESGRILESDITPDIILKGSCQHLNQVTDILLNNAMKYSYDGSTIHLSLQKQGRHALLCVASPGAPLTHEQCIEIFRRFYTGDKARTGGSYGLGLSIAQAIVEEHHGQIWAESSDELNRFYVKLPI